MEMQCVFWESGIEFFLCLIQRHTNDRALKVDHASYESRRRSIQFEFPHGRQLQSTLFNVNKKELPSVQNDNIAAVPMYSDDKDATVPSDNNLNVVNTHQL